MDRQIFDFDQEEIAENGKRIYTERLKAKLELDHKGEIAAINTETGTIFLGKLSWRRSEGGGNSPTRFSTR